MRAATFQTATKYLYGLQRLGIKFGLENVTRVLGAIGDPHLKLSAIHIGGSNGKGSTAAHLESILMQAGYRVGLYTSPHFIRFNERIRINRQPISEEDVVCWTQEILDALPELRPSASRTSPIPITFFEFTTAMAMAHFVRQGADLAILEVGMGGRLDATNVCQPKLSVITSVSLEHQEFLGRTLAEIAREKAGIIKPGVPVISSVRHPRAREVVEATSREKHAPLYRLGKEFRVRGTPASISYHGIQRHWHGLSTSLRGQHQVRNAGVALAAVETLLQQGYAIHDRAIRSGIQDVQWLGRQQWFEGPPRILLDGAHNPEAMRTLCDSLKRDYRYERLRVVMGVMGEKDHRRMIRMISPLVHEFVFCRPNMDRSQDPWVLQAEALKLGCQATVVESVAQGFQDVLDRAGREDLVCVTGSLFAVGEVLAHLEKNHLQESHALS